MLFAKQSPYMAVFLRMNECILEDAMLDNDLAMFRSPHAPRQLRAFPYAELGYCLASQVPLSDADDLYMLHDLHCEGKFAISCHEPLAFELFAPSLGHTCAKGNQQVKPRIERPKLSGDTEASLMEQYPWLTSDDFVKSGAQAGGRSEGRVGGRIGGAGGGQHESDGPEGQAPTGVLDGGDSEDSREDQASGHAAEEGAEEEGRVGRQ